MAQIPLRNEPSADGELNYDYIVAYIESLGYEGWMGAEYIPVSGKSIVVCLQSNLLVKMVSMQKQV